jgi:biopolymer transport protein ExbB/TolQ
MEVDALSPVAMFVNAGKLVMGTLLLASIWTWVLIVSGIYVVVRISKSARASQRP